MTICNDAAALEADLRPDAAAATRRWRSAEARRRRAAQQNEGPSVTYHLPAKLTVPSRNDEQVIEVAKHRAWRRSTTTRPCRC